MIHDLSEPTKRALDLASPITAATAGAVAAITLSQAALIVTIIAGLMSIVWYAIRLHDRLRYGPGR